MFRNLLTAIKQHLIVIPGNDTEEDVRSIQMITKLEDPITILTLEGEVDKAEKLFAWLIDIVNYKSVIITSPVDPNLPSQVYQRIHWYIGKVGLDHEVGLYSSPDAPHIALVYSHKAIEDWYRCGRVGTDFPQSEYASFFYLDRFHGRIIYVQIGDEYRGLKPVSIMVLESEKVEETLEIFLSRMERVTNPYYQRDYWVKMWESARSREANLPPKILNT